MVVRQIFLIMVDLSLPLADNSSCQEPNRENSNRQEYFYTTLVVVIEENGLSVQY